MGKNETDYKTVFANNIVRIRKKAGMTQNDIAAKIIVSQTQLSNMEKGKSDTTTEVLRQLCDVLRVSPEELIYEEEKPDYLKKVSVQTPEPEAAARVRDTRGGGLTLDESSIPLILEYLKCRLERDKREMDSTDLTFAINKLYDCVRTLDSGRNQSKTA